MRKNKNLIVYTSLDAVFSSDDQGNLLNTQMVQLVNNENISAMLNDGSDDLLEEALNNTEFPAEMDSNENVSAMLNDGIVGNLHFNCPANSRICLPSLVTLLSISY